MVLQILYRISAYIESFHLKCKSPFSKLHNKYMNKHGGFMVGMNETQMMFCNYATEKNINFIGANEIVIN
jgi:hypothetical protein